MKKAIILPLFLMISEAALSQQFQKIFEIILPDSIQEAKAAWVDLDNDGLLDILLPVKSKTNRSYFYFIKGDTINTLQVRSEIVPILTDEAFTLTDYDLDNDIDVVVSGNRNGAGTSIYLNKGDFQFEAHTLNVLPFLKAVIADLDNDAQVEWIVSGENNGIGFTSILKQEQDFAWKIVHDSLSFFASALEVLDANGDGRFDLFVSGQISSDSVVSTFLINQDSLYFKPFLSTSLLATSAAAADFNTDGFFDVLISGKDKNGIDRSKLYESIGKTYEVLDYLFALKGTNLFAADLNSDGVVDVNAITKSSLGDTLNVIRYGEQNYDTLQTQKLVTQYYGDAEHDGDLDLVQLVQEESLHVVMYKNEVLQINQAPKRPFNAVALRIFNNLFMYWEKPTDDHTPKQSLTFDVFLGGTLEYQAGSFDLLNEKRLVVWHGNNGTENFQLLRNIQQDDLHFSIQAIDNAFHSGASCIGGGQSICATVEINTLVVCHNEEVVLAVPNPVMWFSFANGFLGSATEFSFQAEQTDTIFSYNPSLIGCSALKVWTVELNNDTIKTALDTQYACAGAQLNFACEPDWTFVQWSSKLNGNLGSTHTIVYTVTQADTVFVTLKNTEGCVIKRSTAINLSMPTVTVDVDQYQIIKGGTVTLHASGAERYAWTPTTGLSQTDIPNPIASPLVTTLYTVTGFDSLGCSQQATVLVVVEDSGFVPTLFTPNSDEKNDELKIYGLTSASNFSFFIYNREGSLVFKTTDVAEVVQRGWDGTTNGTKQPSGVYFWKVKGNMPSGGRLLLNGKDTGSLLLVR